jgi:hypothetical protein
MRWLAKEDAACPAYFIAKLFGLAAKADSQPTTRAALNLLTKNFATKPPLKRKADNKFRNTRIARSGHLAEIRRAE